LNRGLWRKAYRETWPTTLACGLGLLLFEALFAHLAWKFQEQMTGPLFRMPFMRNMIAALTGASAEGGFGPEALGAFAWAHPVAFALIWAHEITFCTRMPAGEIDRGTIDALMGLPVSRTRLWLCESAAWIGSGLFVFALGALGAWLGNLTIPAEARPDPVRIAVVVANFFCVYLAVGGLSCLISARSDRRGKAVAVAFGIVLASFLLNFLAQFWAPAKHVAFLSVLAYHQPMRVVGSAGLPWADMAALLGTAAVLWGAGWAAFERRDIRTV
jgi:hypothetical protein